MSANVLWLPLGELLVERRLLSQRQLELALLEQERSGNRLGEVLVSMGFVSEPSLARMLLEQVGLAAESASAPEPETVVALAPEPVAAPPPEPVALAPEPTVTVVPAAPPLVRGVETQKPDVVIVRLDDEERDQGHRWSRSAGGQRIAELERALEEFERRSAEIQANIAEMRATLRELRATG